MPLDSRRASFALMTPPGEGGIAVFALRGGDAAARLDGAFRGARSVSDAGAGELLYGVVTGAGGGTIDECIVAVTGGRGGRLELNCHGGFVAAREVALRLRELGFEPLGENDLSHAMVEAGDSDGLSEAAARTLARARTRRQMEFILRSEAELRSRIAPLLSKEFDAGAMAAHLSGMLAGARAAQRLAGETRLVVAGPANSGKSTLANALAGEERFLVSPEPGTTRDVVEYAASVGGLAVRIFDTAGALERPDELGEEGWRRSLAAALDANVTLLVMDGSRYPGELDRVCERALPGALRVLAKADLGLGPGAREAAGGGPGALAVSAATGEGMERLRLRVESLAMGGEPGVAFDSAVEEKLQSCLRHARAGDADAARGVLRRLVGLPAEGRAGGRPGGGTAA